jgi:hypothetical protein
LTDGPVQFDSEGRVKEANRLNPDWGTQLAQGVIPLLGLSMETDLQRKLRAIIDHKLTFHGDETFSC